MAKDRLPKGPALYFRLEQHYQVAAFDVLALAKLHPHPADSLGRVTERAFCLMVDELRRDGAKNVFFVTICCPGEPWSL